MDFYIFSKQKYYMYFTYDYEYFNFSEISEKNKMYFDFGVSTLIIINLEISKKTRLTFLDKLFKVLVNVNTSLAFLQSILLKYV